MDSFLQRSESARPICGSHVVKVHEEESTDADFDACVHGSLANCLYSGRNSGQRGHISRCKLPEAD